MHHVFCGLHVIQKLGKYAEKAIYEWEKIIEEQGKMHDGFKLTQKSRTYNLLFEISKLLSLTEIKKMEMLMNDRHI